MGSAAPEVTSAAAVGRGAPGVPSGFERVRESGDGDCLFHCIARQALGDTRLAAQARRELCDWMEAHLPPSARAAGRSGLSDLHSRMIWEQRQELWAADDDAPALQYIQQMRRMGEWGTGLEAMCAAYRHARPVHIWSPDGYSELRPPDGVGSSSSSSEPILLMHNGRNHWDSLRPLPGAEPAAHRRRDAASKEDEARDEELALALSLSLVAAFPDVGLDARDQRRAAAAAAAEQRGQHQASRGLTTKAGPSAAAAPEPGVKPGMSRSAALALSAATAQASAVAAPEVPAVSEDRAQSATGGEPIAAGPWDRRREARAAAALQTSADSTAGAAPALAAGLSLASVDQAFNELEKCLEALQRVGLNGAEATEALAACNGDLERVKELYGIDWDDQGRTVQTPFA